KMASYDDNPAGGRPSRRHSELGPHRQPEGPYGRSPGRDGEPPGPVGHRMDKPARTGRGLFRRFTIKHARIARRRTLLAIFAVLIMLSGVGIVCVTYFLDSVKTSSELKFPETTTVFYSNGTVLAKLGEVTRYELAFDEMIDPVVKSIVASEDQTFWTNDGVDF